MYRPHSGLRGARAAAAWVLMVTGCGEAGTSLDSRPQASGADLSLPALQNLLDEPGALERYGYTAQRGDMQLVTIDTCAESPSCFGNNPGWLYGVMRVPPSPQETPLADRLGAEGLLQSWRLRHDEAVLFVGKTPPEAMYMGFTPYVFSRVNAAGARRTVFGSLSDTTNHLTLGELPCLEGEGGGNTGWHGRGKAHGHGRGCTSAFDQPLAVLITASAEAEARAEELLADLHFPAERIVRLRVPGQALRLGLDAAADELSALLRMADWADPEAASAYLEEPSGVVVRLTPIEQAPAGALHPVPKLKSRSTPNLEVPMAASLNKAIAAVRLQNDRATRTTALAALTPFPFDSGYQCLSLLANCSGDNRDTAYAASSPALLRPSPDAFFYVVGAIHEYTGMATWTGISVYETVKTAGVLGVVPSEAVGSAHAYLPVDDPNRDKIFVIKLARSCAEGEPYCYTVPSTGWPSVALDQPVVVMERAYLHPVTGVGPPPSGFKSATLIRYNPR